MINYDKELVAALKTVLPTHYEMNLHSGLTLPCISYMENNNYDDATGDTLGYDRLSYVVKVWGNDKATVQTYSVEVDRVMRELGFKRLSSGELYDRNSTRLQKIMIFEALALEVYGG